MQLLVIGSTHRKLRATEIPARSRAREGVIERITPIEIRIERITCEAP